MRSSIRKIVIAVTYGEISEAVYRILWICLLDAKEDKGVKRQKKEKQENNLMSG